MTTAADLRKLLPWFPLSELDFEFDLEVLTGARITPATPDDPVATVARILEIERESEWTNTLANGFPQPCIEARHEAVVDDRQTFELVTTPAVIETVMESDCAGEFEGIVGTDHATVYVYDGDVEPNGGIYDGAAYGENYDRLVDVKDEYDPENRFRVNQNIPPSRGSSMDRADHGPEM